MGLFSSGHCRMHKTTCQVCTRFNDGDSVMQLGRLKSTSWRSTDQIEMQRQGSLLRTHSHALPCHSRYEIALHASIVHYDSRSRPGCGAPARRTASSCSSTTRSGNGWAPRCACRAPTTHFRECPAGYARVLHDLLDRVGCCWHRFRSNRLIPAVRPQQELDTPFVHCCSKCAAPTPSLSYVDVRASLYH